MAELGTEYTCQACGGTFERELADEVVLAETRAIFGEVPPEERAIMCHDCWLKSIAVLAHVHAEIIALCRQELEPGSAVSSGRTLARRILEMCGEEVGRG